MAESKIKSTARAMAFVRATEGAVPPEDRLFEDPLAAVFLTRVERFGLSLLRSRRFYSWAMHARDRQTRGLWGWLLARTRYIDDTLSAALAGGEFEQVAILGAGADSRALRIPGIGSTAVFEVDHPATQAWKRRRLEKVLPSLPPHLHFVPIDFEQSSLEPALHTAGYRDDVRSFFVWEGVTQYIRSEAVDATLRFVRDHSASGSRIAFTYADRRAVEGSDGFEDLAWLLAYLKRTGEPWIFGLLPAAIPSFLEERGLRLVEHVGAPELRERLVPSTRPLQISRVEHVVLAELP